MGEITLGSAATGRLRRASIEATITRADGSVEHLGEIAATEFALTSRLGAAFRRIFARPA